MTALADNPPTTMDPSVTKIFGHGLIRDLVNLRCWNRLRIKLESTEIRREKNDTAFADQPHQSDQ